MAGNVISTQVIENGNSRYVVKFTNFSDGTGETSVVKVDPTSSGDMGVVIGGRTFYPGTHLKLRSIFYNVGYVAASAVRLQWDATTPQDLMILQGWDERTYYGRMFGGIPVPSVTGATGKILFTTEGFVAGSFYAVTMGFKKDIVQT